MGVSCACFATPYRLRFENGSQSESNDHGLSYPRVYSGASQAVLFVRQRLQSFFFQSYILLVSKVPTLRLVKGPLYTHYALTNPSLSGGGCLRPGCRC